MDMFDTDMYQITVFVRARNCHVTTVCSTTEIRTSAVPESQCPVCCGVRFTVVLPGRLLGGVAGRLCTRLATPPAMYPVG